MPSGICSALPARTVAVQGVLTRWLPASRTVAPGTSGEKAPLHSLLRSRKRTANLRRPASRDLGAPGVRLERFPRGRPGARPRIRPCRAPRRTVEAGPGARRMRALVQPAGLGHVRRCQPRRRAELRRPGCPTPLAGTARVLRPHAARGQRRQRHSDCPTCQRVCQKFDRRKGGVCREVPSNVLGCLHRLGRHSNRRARRARHLGAHAV